jgi:hypothetical protein
MPKQYARDLRRVVCEQLVAGEKVSVICRRRSPTSDRAS